MAAQPIAETPAAIRQQLLVQRREAGGMRQRHQTGSAQTRVIRHAMQVPASDAYLMRCGRSVSASFNQEEPTD
jgi:hypothetical protein